VNIVTPRESTRDGGRGAMALHEDPPSRLEVQAVPVPGVGDASSWTSRQGSRHGRSALDIAARIRMPVDLVVHVLRIEERRGHAVCVNGEWRATDLLRRQHGGALRDLEPFNTPHDAKEATTT